MNELSDRQFTSAVESWLAEDGPQVAPDRLVETVLLRLPDISLGKRPGLLHMAIVAVAASLATLAIGLAAGWFAVQQVGPAPTITPRPTASPSGAAFCAAEKPACGGLLAARINYSTSRFAPALEFSLPTAIWTVPVDESSRFQLVVASDTRRVIGFYHGPQAVDARGNPIAGADSPAALIAAWRRNSELIVGPTRETSLLGKQASYVDIQPSPSAATHADKCGPELIGLFCMPIFEVGTGTSKAEAYFGYAGRWRIYLLPQADGVLALTVEAHHSVDPAELSALAAPILASLHLSR
jgi:hypothetical protein